MAKKKEFIAMLLAGGQGSRLGALTKSVAKPAVSFGGKYRIIDFPLSNCANSHIDTVGVLTQYRPLRLNAYLGTGHAWDMNGRDGGVFILPPYATESGAEWYKGTADAIYQNLDFIDLYDPEYVIILSADQIYRMDYQDMLATHKKHNADLSVAVMQVPWEDASRFGIMTAKETGEIVKFTEKPKNPDSNLASMGIYIFTKSVLKKALMEDAVDPNSEHDFGNNIIPKLLAEGKHLFTYEFAGYWKDVGTFGSYHQISMELLDENPEFDLYDQENPILSNTNSQPPQYIGANGCIRQSIAANGTRIFGTVEHSVLGADAFVGEGAFVKDSVILPGARVEAGAKVVRAILGDGAIVKENSVFGSEDESVAIAVLGNEAVYGVGGNE